METAIPALIIIALLLLTSVTLAEEILSSHEIAAESWLAMEHRELERSRTAISILGVTPSATQAVIALSNEGETKLTDFEEWDVILHADSTAAWYPYTTTLTSDTWTESISDVLEPGIFNPGEEMSITLEAGIGTDNLVVLTTPNGVTASQVFTHSP